MLYYATIITGDHVTDCTHCPSIFPVLGLKSRARRFREFNIDERLPVPHRYIILKEKFSMEGCKSFILCRKIEHK